MTKLLNILTMSKWIYVPSINPLTWEYTFLKNGVGNSIYIEQEEGRLFPIIANCDWNYRFISDTSIEVIFEDGTKETIELRIDDSPVTTYKRNDSNFKYIFMKGLFCSKHLFQCDSNFPFDVYDAEYSEFLGYEHKVPNDIDFDTFLDSLNKHKQI